MTPVLCPALFANNVVNPLLDYILLASVVFLLRYRVPKVVETLRYKPGGREFDFLWGH